MKQILFWMDLAICSLWAIAFLGSREWLIIPLILTLLTISSRIALSFFLYRQESKSWIPLSFLWGFSLLALIIGFELDIFDAYLVGLWELRTYSCIILGLDLSRSASWWTSLLTSFWLWIAPTIMYIVARCRKKLTRSELTWKDGLGAILWRDEAAKTYTKLLLIAIVALAAGLAMFPRMNFLACLVLPAVSLYYLAKYYRVQSAKIWWMIISMCIFFFAQKFSGAWRIGMLTFSLLMVGYLCFSLFYRNKGLLSLFVVALLYHGSILPSLAIGYNQYTCIDYERFRPLESYRGIFFIKDPATQNIGLRDRYGLLISPEYDKATYSNEKHLWGKLKLWKDGSYDLYDICNNRMEEVEDIDR